MGTPKGGFRHCFGENIEVYTASGDHPLEAVRNVVRGLRKIEKETDRKIYLSNINVEYDSYNDEYHAVVYTFGPLV